MRAEGERVALATEFERGYAERSGISVEKLRSHGRIVATCDGRGCRFFQIVRGLRQRRHLVRRVAEDESQASLPLPATPSGRYLKNAEP